ncbi:MAG: hypothetical protein IPP43_13070 [Chitinophagaceae bacterium]|nr:hypothetical protein [Chitinophagaceae bacterium]
MKELNHADQVEWILSLPDPNLNQIPGVCYTAFVTVYISIMVKVAETTSGVSLYQKKEIERKLEKCVPEKRDCKISGKRFFK